MALTPRIAGTNLVPAGGGRFAANGAVAIVDPTPLTELNQINALIYEGESEFQYDHFDPRREQFARRRAYDQFGRPFEQTPERRINNPMMQNSSESFAAAFDVANNSTAQMTNDHTHPRPTATLDDIIATYEQTAEVIYDEVPPRGENLSMTS